MKRSHGVGRGRKCRAVMQNCGRVERVHNLQSCVRGGEGHNCKAASEGFEIVEGRMDVVNEKGEMWICGLRLPILEIVDIDDKIGPQLGIQEDVPLLEYSRWPFELQTLLMVYFPVSLANVLPLFLVRR
jgi:hypothetical protein